jgi:tetratricopeptide (TPR) repeat protein
MEVERARSLYRGGRFDEAAAILEERCQRQPDDADAWWMLGCVARHRGQTADSDRAFQRAAELLPRQMPPPHRVPVAVFEGLVRQAREDIRRGGQRGRERLGVEVDVGATELEVGVQQLPSGEAVRGGLGPDARWSRDGDRVVVYQVSHENLAGSDRQLLQLLTATLHAAYGDR